MDRCTSPSYNRRKHSYRQGICAVAFSPSFIPEFSPSVVASSTKRQDQERWKAHHHRYAKYAREYSRKATVGEFAYAPNTLGGDLDTRLTIKIHTQILIHTRILQEKMDRQLQIL